MEGENGNGANWDGEKCEQEIERVIHLAGGGGEIREVEEMGQEMERNGSDRKEEVRWRERERGGGGFDRQEVL